MSEVMRIVIVDDEPLARAVLREYAGADPRIEIVADCANGFEEVKAVGGPKPELVLVEAQDDYVAFKSEGKQFLKDQTLSAVETTLDPARFVRIHRSFILNIDRIAKVELYAKDS